MLTQLDYSRLQRIFYQSTVTCRNPVVFSLQTYNVTSAGTFTDFTGDSDRASFEIDYKLKCLYKRTLSDKYRAKYGIDEDIVALILFSPLQLATIAGSQVLIDTIMKTKQKARVVLFDKVYRIKQIVDHEPFSLNGKPTNIAYELRLQNEK